MSSEFDRNDLITRREFTVESVLALLAGVTITVSGCGDGDDGPSSPSPAPAASSDVAGAISGNHGHTATVTAARISAGAAIALDITGQANHPHTVELSADEVRRIGQRQQVMKTSSSDAGHTHAVTFN